jgi:hypothetical protein
MIIDPDKNKPIQVPNIASETLNMRITKLYKQGFLKLSDLKKRSMTKIALEIIYNYFEHSVPPHFWEGIMDYKPKKRKPARYGKPKSNKKSKDKSLYDYKWDGDQLTWDF